MKRILTLLILTFILGNIKSQTYQYVMSFENFKQPNESTFTFDVYLENTGLQDFLLFSYGFQITYNNQILNGGSFQAAHCTYVNGTSQLQEPLTIEDVPYASPTFPISSNFSVAGVGTPLVMASTPVNPQNADLLTFMGVGQKKRIGTFQVRLRNQFTVAGSRFRNFADEAPNFQWSAGFTTVSRALDYFYWEDYGTYHATSAEASPITSRTLVMNTDNREMAGFCFTGSGSYNTNTLWNNTLTNLEAGFNVVPASTNNAIIAGNANLNDNRTITDLTINSAGNLVLTQSGSLRVNGVFYKDNTSLASLTILSDGTGTGSLIHNTSGITAVSNRYLPGSSLAWHTISAPVSGMSITGSNFEPGANDDFYLWYEPSPGIWVNYKNQDGSGGSPSFPVANSGNNFGVGRGYLVAYDAANPTKTFTGALNAGNVNVVLSKSAAKSWSYEPGWNLVGNPYASSLNFSALNTVGVLAENFAQVYDPAFGGGGGYVQVTTIAPNQGFFVLAATDGAVLSMNNSHQVHGGTFLKNQGITADDMILISLSTDGYYDEARVFINQASAMEHDFYDASKMFSFNSQMPQVYTSSTDERMLAINSIPSVSESTSIPLSIRVPESGSPVNLNLSLTEITGVFADQTIVIHDKKENQYYYPSNAPAYAFTASNEDDPDRFTIYFTTVGVPETELASMMSAYTYGDILFVSSQLNSVLVEMFNIHGQRVLSREVGQGLSSIPVSLPAGTYMIKMVGAGETATRKVVIK